MAAALTQRNEDLHISFHPLTHSAVLFHYSATHTRPYVNYAEFCNSAPLGLN